MALNFNQTPTATGKPPALSKGLRSQSSDYTLSSSRHLSLLEEKNGLTSEER